MMSQSLPASYNSQFDPSLLLAEDKPCIEELREMYSDFFHPDCITKTEIIQSKTVQGLGEKYTVYVIKVTLPFSEYIIEKRYNLFSELYKKIEKNYKGIGLENTTFPSKKIFGSFNPSTIEYRKLHLHKFLEFLNEKYKEHEIVEFLEFIEIKKRIEMLQRTSNKSIEIIPSPNSDKHSKNLEKIVHFITLFNKSQKDLLKLYKDFELFYFETQPRLTKDLAKLLLVGDDSLQGMIHFCGKFDIKSNSHLSCNAGLNLLARLLDHESNKEADLFKLIFCTASLRDIMFLYFDEHIQGKGSKQLCKIAAMKLLHIFLINNPKTDVSQILNDDESIKEYQQWKTSQMMTSIKAEHFVLHTEEK